VIRKPLTVFSCRRGFETARRRRWRLACGKAACPAIVLSRAPTSHGQLIRAGARRLSAAHHEDKPPSSEGERGEALRAPCFICSKGMRRCR
jgi:hypothetical protein